MQDLQIQKAHDKKCLCVSLSNRNLQKLFQTNKHCCTLSLINELAFAAAGCGQADIH